MENNCDCLGGFEKIRLFVFSALQVCENKREKDGKFDYSADADAAAGSGADAVAASFSSPAAALVFFGLTCEYCKHIN